LATMPERRRRRLAVALPPRFKFANFSKIWANWQPHSSCIGLKCVAFGFSNLKRPRNKPSLWDLTSRGALRSARSWCWWALPCFRRAESWQRRLLWRDARAHELVLRRIYLRQYSDHTGGCLQICQRGAHHAPDGLRDKDYSTTRLDGRQRSLRIRRRDTGGERSTANAKSARTSRLPRSRTGLGPQSGSWVTSIVAGILGGAAVRTYSKRISSYFAKRLSNMAPFWITTLGRRSSNHRRYGSPHRRHPAGWRTRYS